MSKIRHCVRAFGGGLCLFLPLLAATAQKPRRQIHWEQYTTANGMPSNRVLCVAADGGRTWAGTDNGLVLIENGKVTKVYQPEDGLIANVVTALAVAPDTGDLWIATYGGLSRYSAGIFQNYIGLTSGLANDVVYDVAVKDGFVWAATAMGLSRLNLRSGSWTTFDNRNTPMVDPWPDAVTVDKERAFIATWGSGVLEYIFADFHWISSRNDGSREPAASVSNPAMDFTTGVAVDSKSGELWTATRGGLIRQDKNTWHRYTSTNSGLASNSINAIRLHDGKLWLCTTRGLSVFTPKTSTWVNYHFISQTQGREVHVVAEDGAAGEQEPPREGKENNIFSAAFHGSEIWLASEAGLSVGALVQLKQTAQLSQDIEITNQAVNARPTSKVASKSALSAYSLNPSTINIGFFGPVENSPDVPYGFSMMHGAQLAVEEANDRGGYSDRIHKMTKYELKIHNDSASWGASTTEPVNMAQDEHVVAILGSIDGAATHTLLSVATELGVPVVNTGTVDANIVDMDTPSFMRLMPGDRQQSRALVQYIAGQKRIHRIGIVREDARYARVGAEAFNEEAGRTGLTSLIEEKFQPGASDFSSQLRELRDANVDGVILWCHPAEGAMILKQMRTLGVQVPAFGPSYLASPVLIELAGTASEGFVATSVLDPEHPSEELQRFDKSYRSRFNETPDPYASYAYDGMNLLIAAIEKVGPNREKIDEALYQHRLNSYEGASGNLSFDDHLNNTVPLTMARVEGGRFVYWVPSAVR